MTAWDWQWQMAWDPWEEMQRPDWRVRAWRMQRDRAKRAKEFEERRRLVALQESAALRRLREVRASRMPTAVKRSTATATGAVGTARVPSQRERFAETDTTYATIGGWYDNRFYDTSGIVGARPQAGMDLGRLYRQTEQGLISVDGRVRAAAADGLERMVTSRGEIFWYDPDYFQRDGEYLVRGDTSLLINQVATKNPIGRTAEGARILGHVGGSAPLPTSVYAWSPGVGLYARHVDATVWENGGTVQSLIEQWEAEQAKGATGGTQ